jgi:CheY-like chemotaxis protein
VGEADYWPELSHELGSSVSVIKGLADTLTDHRHALSEQDIDECIARIRRRSERLQLLVTDVHHFSIRGGRGFPVRLEPVHLAAAAKRALVDSPPPPRKSLQLAVPDDLLVVADYERLDQVFENLLTNAYEYGGERIRVDAVETSEGVIVSVSDDGEGVPEELRPRLFERFTRGANAHEIEGSGLGLSIVRGLVEAFGGHAWYEAAEPTGARFSFMVAAAREGVEYGRSSPQSNTPPARVLIVDDEPDIRFLLRVLLESAGHEVFQASEGREALTVSKEKHPDLVITDLMMPAMDGGELIERLRSDPETSSVPIMLVSARDGHHVKDVDIVLLKPFNPQELLTAVKKLLDQER